MSQGEIDRCISEQRWCVDYLNGKRTSADPPGNEEGAKRGLNDWMAEELEIRTGLQTKLERYQQFIRNKVVLSKDQGFIVEPEELSPALNAHSKVAVQWAVKGGRRALFESFGMAKTRQQLAIVDLILRRVSGRALIVAPLGVRQEFQNEAQIMGLSIRAVRSIGECAETGIHLTNYETVREQKLDPSGFVVASLDEAAILRGFGGVKTFREFMRLFEGVRYRFVATATPDPNEYIELLAYAAFLGVMDVGQAKTRFFKRDSTKADVLTLHPHKVEEFWMWVASWALFLQKPSDFGPQFSDAGYDLPPLEIVHHEIEVDNTGATPERDGQGRLYREAMHGVVDAAREKRNTLPERIDVAREIVEANPDEHYILWHDLEDERRAIKSAIPDVVDLYGAQRANRKTLENLETAIGDFATGKINRIACKPQMFGAGVNWQKHCHIAIFCGIGYKFADFIQAIHRIFRFLQTETVQIHLIYARSERGVLKRLMEKWENHKRQVAKMSQIIREYGLSELALAQALTRAIGVKRVEASGNGWNLVNNDSVVETTHMADASVGLILTSIPFSTQYEYTPSYMDFGHTEDNQQFFEQMDFLTPELYRVLQPGRVAAIHVKDRTVPGGMTGMGFQEAYPFHADVIQHFRKHGFRYLGMKTIVTDVVRENNQTYRLGWTEQCKDATKMGYGMPEYLLLFRKPQTDRSRGYADVPVRKDKVRYSKARWQVDAHGFARSPGNRTLTPEELMGVPHQKIFGMFHDFYLNHVYNFEHHVKLGDEMERQGRLPVTFMLLQPPSWHPDVWTDITRMLSVNAAQAAKGRQMHLCPLQYDIADRVIVQMSNEGDLVYDPFSGLGTVVFRAVSLRRRGYGVELNPGYWADGVSYCKAAEQKMGMPSLFDDLPDEIKD